MGAANNYRGVQRVSRMSYVFCKASQKSPFASASSTAAAAARPRHGPHTHIYLQPPEDKDTKAAPDWARHLPTLHAQSCARLQIHNINWDARAPIPATALHFASNKTALNLSRIARSCCHVQGRRTEKGPTAKLKEVEMTVLPSSCCLSSWFYRVSWRGVQLFALMNNILNSSPFHLICISP